MMNNSSLINYIKEAVAGGISNEQIATDLINSGWRLADIVGLLANDSNIPQESDYRYDANNGLLVDGVSRVYGGVVALDNVSFTVPTGTVTALLGPNGAGKTTLVRIMATLLKSDVGDVLVAGKNILKDGDGVRSIIGITGQFTALDINLTGRENLELIGRLYHLGKNYLTTRTSELLSDFELADAADRLVKTYSGGMKRKLDLAASIIHNPRILFLDEPTTGLDPHSRAQMWEVIKNLVKSGTTVLLTTQYLEEADHLADSIVVLNKGSMIAHGTPQELKDRVGGEILEIHVHDHVTAQVAAKAVSELGSESPHIDPESGRITIPAGKKGVSILLDAIRLLDIARIKIDDILLRRPTLDDVFLAITGKGSESINN